MHAVGLCVSKVEADEEALTCVDKGEGMHRVLNKTTTASDPLRPFLGLALHWRTFV